MYIILSIIIPVVNKHNKHIAR